MFKKGLAVFAVVCLGGGAFAGFAYSTSRDNPPNSHDLTLRGKVDKAFMVMTKTGAQTFTNTSFAQLTADTIPVPATGNYRAIVRFSGESECHAASWCTARINVDGVEANPKSSSDFAFDTEDGGLWESNSMDRTSDTIAGTGTVRNVVVEVEIAVIGGGNWRLDDWSVVTELIKV
jgi:hypothetical protein